MENQPVDGYDSPATDWPGSGYATVPQSQWTPQKAKSKRNNIIELILQQTVLALQGFLSPGSGFGQLNTWGSGVTTLLTEHTEAIADLEDIAAAARSTPAYVADIDDMASCDRTRLAMFGYGTQKYIDILTGVYCAFDDHFHTVGTTCFRPGTVTGSTVGDIIYTPVIVDRVGTLEGVRWIVGADTAIASIDYYEMAVCAYNPTNGNIEKLWGSGNIKDGLPSTTSMAEAYVGFGFGTPQQTTPGQILMVAHQQTAPGLLQIGRRFAAAINPPVGRPGQLLDAACFISPDHSQGIPSSISFAGLSRENRFIPWTGIKVAALP